MKICCKVLNRMDAYLVWHHLVWIIWTTTGNIYLHICNWHDVEHIVMEMEEHRPKAA